MFCLSIKSPICLLRLYERSQILFAKSNEIIPSEALFLFSSLFKSFIWLAFKFSRFPVNILVASC
jgi:hypothetical protein